MKNNEIFAFNNSIETGLRSLSILASAFPRGYNIDHLVFFDHMVVNSGDFDINEESMHPPVPNRTGEIFVRRNLIQMGLQLYQLKGLIEKKYSSNGILYFATEEAMPFLESLSEEYSSQLYTRANWLILNYGHNNILELKQLILKSINKSREEFNIEIL